MQKQSQQRTKVKVIVESFTDGKCQPCEDLKREAESLADKYDIELVEVQIDPKNPDKKMVEYFGGDADLATVPVVIIQSECKSKKDTGYHDGMLEEEIRKVQCNVRKK